MHADLIVVMLAVTLAVMLAVQAVALSVTAPRVQLVRPALTGRRDHVRMIVRSGVNKSKAATPSANY
jgi:hypothetical protein